MSDGIHSCSYYCVRPACVLAQRDEMRERGFNRLPSDKVVMQQALDALEWYAECSVVAGKASDASNAIRAALAAPQSEPVAWRYFYPDGFWRFSNGEHVNGCGPCEAQALYTSPPAAPSVPASQWIACSERMPDDDIQVLVWAIGHLVEHGNCWVAARAGDRFVDDDGRTVSGVTHWMDLPAEPPK